MKKKTTTNKYSRHYYVFLNLYIMYFKFYINFLFLLLLFILFILKFYFFANIKTTQHTKN